MNNAESFRPIVSETAPCKCCANSALLFGVVDFNKCCEDLRRPPKRPSGIPIYYYRCPNCEMIFTTAFDSFTNQDFLTYIYNEGYADVDPDYASARPTANAQAIASTFATTPNISILDYGGGNGTLANYLRSVGFTDVTTYDPFVAAHSQRPDRQFDLIVSFEVLEHSHRPRETLADIVSLRKPASVLFFSTLLVTAEIAKHGLSWWYIAPRNGHVTIHSKKALQMMLAEHGLLLGSKDHIHAAWKIVPAFARHVIPQSPANIFQ